MTLAIQPKNLELLLMSVEQEFAVLSPQLKKIALCIEKSREQIAFLGIQELASLCGVQPSAIVRFAKRFGFSGFSALQSLFKAGAQKRLAPGTDYRSRIRTLIESENKSLPSRKLAREVIASSIDSLHSLDLALSDETFDQAVELLIKSSTIWLAAARRSFPVGAYLAYALQQTAKPIQWMNGVGLMQQGQLNALSSHDMMVAISFEPYAQETLSAIQSAVERRAKVLVITDSQFNQVAKLATVCLVVQEGSTFGFRSLTSTMCLAQSLFLAMTYRMELEQE